MSNKYAENMQNLCNKYAEIMQHICNIYTNTMQHIYRIYATPNIQESFNGPVIEKCIIAEIGNVSTVQYLTKLDFCHGTKQRPRTSTNTLIFEILRGNA